MNDKTWLAPWEHTCWVGAMRPPRGMTTSRKGEEEEKLRSARSESSSDRERVDQDISIAARPRAKHRNTLVALAYSRLPGVDGNSPRSSHGNGSSSTGRDAARPAGVGRLISADKGSLAVGRSPEAHHPDGSLTLLVGRAINVESRDICILYLEGAFFFISSDKSQRTRSGLKGDRTYMTEAAAA